MTATGHAVIGAVIAAKIGNPALAIPIAIASHIAADAFPHWDIGTNRKSKTHNLFFVESIIDVMLSFLSAYLVIQFLAPQTNLFYGFIVVIAAQFFDWISAPYIFLHWNFPPFPALAKFQKLFDNRLNKPWGIIGQVGIVLLLVVVAKMV